VLAAAAEPTGDSSLVWRAAGRLGIGVQAAAPAAEASLVEFGAQVRFRHPLVRSAAHGSASAQDLREVHHALAEATDPAADPDRRAWHLAQATAVPDEDVAVELERSAGRAQARGGLAAAAAFLERAAILTPDPVRRAQRLLAGARAKRDAGALDAALGLLVAVGVGEGIYCAVGLSWPAVGAGFAIAGLSMPLILGRSRDDRIGAYVAAVPALGLAALGYASLSLLGGLTAGIN
jgi:hypothetical protein